MSTQKNTFESRIGGMTFTSHAHSLSVWFVLALRLMMGAILLRAGASKLLAPEPFSAAGYLANVAAVNGNPLADLFAAMVASDAVLASVNVLVPVGEFAIGLALLTGTLVRLAAFFGAVFMALIYFGNWGVDHGLINGDFAYLLVFLAVAAFGAGRILGLDAYIERYRVDGTPLIEKYPALDYVLG